MSAHGQSHHGVVKVMLAVLAILCSAGTFVAAQDRPAPKWELYGGYSFFYPDADVHGVLPGGILPASSRLESNPQGVGVSITYNFNRWFGLTVDGSGHWSDDETTVARRIDDAGFFNLSMGPKVTFRSRHFSPFIEALVGDHRLSPDAFHAIDKLGFMGGGGLDINVSRHFALRLLRADYVWSNYRYGPSETTAPTEVRGVRLQSGLVLMWGGKSPEPISASCSTTPAEVLAGEPVSAAVTVDSFHTHRMLTYMWSSTGGSVNGKDANATIATDGVPAGRYTVVARVSDSRRPKDGQASCNSAFEVKERRRNPPVISCSANPSGVQTGTPSSIGCTCTSDDNVPVTVSGWTASAGTVSGSGSTAVLDTSGVSSGSITVTATCRDARGLTTQAKALVMVENPPQVSPEVIRLEARLALHSIYFPTAQPRAKYPNGGLLTSQEQTLLSLASDFQKYRELKPGAHLILGSHADPRGSVEYNQALSERRVERTRNFLVEHGVPAGDIQTKAFGEEQNMTDAQVRDAVERNPQLTPAQRQRVLDNMATIILASNRRVDVTLSTTGQQSVRQYPFNAADALTLLQQEGTHKTARPVAHKKAKSTSP